MDEIRVQLGMEFALEQLKEALEIINTDPTVFAEKRGLDGHSVWPYIVGMLQIDIESAVHYLNKGLEGLNNN